jgi:hypothetical protein
MIRMIIGVIVALSGFTGFPQGQIVQGLLIIALGAVIFMWGYRARQDKLAMRAEERGMDMEAAAYAAQADKTYTFRITGVTHPCRFANGYYDRQTAISSTRIGDPLFLHQYEWEGEPAIAVINRKTGHDLGVVPAEKVQRILKLMQQYDTSAVLVAKEDFDWQNDTYTGCDVRIDCVERGVNS